MPSLHSIETRFKWLPEYAKYIAQHATAQYYLFDILKTTGMLMPSPKPKLSFDQFITENTNQ